MSDPDYGGPNFDLGAHITDKYIEAVREYRAAEGGRIGREILIGTDISLRGDVTEIEAALAVAASLCSRHGPMPYVAVRHSGHPRHGVNVDVKPRPEIPVGRNDICPCGSGRKFKRCCKG